METPPRSRFEDPFVEGERPARAVLEEERSAYSPPLNSSIARELSKRAQRRLHTPRTLGGMEPCIWKKPTARTSENEVRLRHGYTVEKRRCAGAKVLPIA